MSKPIQGTHVMEVIRRTLAPSAVAPDSQTPVIDEAIALALVGGDRDALREVKDLCITETPHLLDEIEHALIEGQADALSAASHTLRGMYLVFGPNEMVTLAGRLEELAIARDLVAAAVASEVLRPAAARLMTALRCPEPTVGSSASGASEPTRFGGGMHKSGD